jgi:hypothetical protein
LQKGIALSNPPASFNSPDPRHVDVHQDGVEVPHCDVVESLLTVGRLGHLETERIQSAPQHVAEFRVVIRNQNVGVRRGHHGESGVGNGRQSH